MNRLWLMAFAVFSMSLVAQNKKKGMRADNWYYVMELQIFQDSTRNLDFNTVQEQKFTDLAEIEPNFEATIWYRFKIPPFDQTDTLMIQSLDTGNGTLFVPREKQYQRLPIGLMESLPQYLNTNAEKFIAYVYNQGIDHTKYFYLKEDILVHWSSGIKRRRPIFVYTDNREAIVSTLAIKSLEGREYHFYVGVALMSFLLFFIGFLINKNNAFLTYSLYLFMVVLYYGNRLIVPMNWYNQTLPELYFYINQATRFGILFTYYYFIYAFLDVPNKFKRIYKYAKYSLVCIAVFSVLNLTSMLVFPFLPGRFQILNTFYTLATINGLILVGLMFFNKPDRIAIITLIGTLLINLGSVISVYLGDAVFLLKMVVIETAVFFGVISYQNKLKEKVASENRLALGLAKKEKESLKQLDVLKSRLFENISHEFRTPLTLIRVPVEEALLDKNPISDADLSIIQNNTKRLTNLIEDLLALSKLESKTMKINPKRGNPISQLEDLSIQFKSYAQSKEIVFKVDLDDYGLTALYDHSVLETCVNNLLSNALKFTDKEGAIGLHAQIEKDQLEIKVSDTGMGIKAEDQLKIFDRFYQVSEKDETQPGSGIGLSIVKELIALHQGTISVESVPDQGSVFRVTIPLEDIEKGPKPKLEKGKDSIPVAEKVSVQEGVHGASLVSARSVLVVEDNLELLQFLNDRLRKKYRVKTAKNGKIGWDIAFKWLPDLIISDVMMPVMNGIELCRKVKNNSKTAHIPVVLLTAKSDERDELVGLGTGADAYITKPFSLEKLELVIAQRIALRKLLRDRYQKNTLFDADADGITTAEEDFLQRVQQIFQNRLTDATFNAEKFASDIGMSRMQLHRNMKKIIDKTPAELIRTERLLLAKTLLNDSKLSIKEIAYQSGFNSPSYFIKVFKEKYKSTPSEYVGKTPI
nr:ATP-binding protein [uncultured Allomuricauda sp.]